MRATGVSVRQGPGYWQEFEYRKAWARDRLRRLAEAFAIDVGAYAVMANCLHVVLKQRPKAAIK